MESCHLPNLSVQIAPDCISEYLIFIFSRPYFQYSELCHARAYKQKKAKNAPAYTGLHGHT